MSDRWVVSGVVVGGTDLMPHRWAVFGVVMEMTRCLITGLSFGYVVEPSWCPVDGLC